MKLSIIIPCYNEEKNLPLLLDRSKLLLKAPDIEIIIVNNGSTDNTENVLNNLLSEHPNCKIVKIIKNKGYGFGILEGLKVARGDILGWTHADMQTDPEDVMQGLKLFNEIDEKVFVKGVRNGRPIKDNIFTFGMSVFESFYFKRIMWDINAQPTMFSRNLFENWESPPNDFSLDLYAYYKAQVHGFNIRRFKVKFAKRAYGVSHWNIDWYSKWKFITRTIRYSIKLKKDM
jgi:glycosyltransferase involved in cell wall biosynthesis